MGTLEVWKKDFLRLYTSLNGEIDRKKAINLKRANFPEKLYRFRSLEKREYIEKEIVEGKIYLAHAGQLNDPFDSRYLLSQHSPSKYLGNKEEYRKGFAGIIEPSRLEEIFSNDEWYEQLIKYVAEQEATEDNRELLEKVMIQTVMEQLEGINQDSSNVLRNMNRIACFTETIDNLPMWAHYANNHRGICLEYDMKFVTLHIIDRIFPVYYVKVLPDGLSENVRKNISLESHMDYLLIHKLKDWSYEREWRWIFPIGMFPSAHSNIPEDYFVTGKEYPFTYPFKIYLGCNIAEDDEKFVRDLAKSKHIPVMKMKVTEYGLTAE